jgi:septal ring factor EnvC (AmiA/AmiB activator)
LRDVFADIPRQIEDAQPFGTRRGRLPMPLLGSLDSGFGGTLPDGRRSQGWLLGARPGTHVTAVAPGRVAFADWLKGYGLIVILDHGDGYMSLYAQNDSLMKEVGDWVSRGEALAGVGSSGGQDRPALYFELRHNGRPINPKDWIRRP